MKASLPSSTNVMAVDKKRPPKSIPVRYTYYEDKPDEIERVYQFLFNNLARKGGCM
jgi:hypothetical protein